MLPRRTSKIDIANREETREFLGQSVGFENELISQTNFPRQPTREDARAWLIFLKRLSMDVRGNRPETAASGPEYAVKWRLWQGGKLVTGKTWAQIRDTSISRIAHRRRFGLREDRTRCAA